MNKILTIVIPTYNMEKYLRRCLDSLIIDDKELLKKIEVLVINDGSTDSSSAIAHEYQEKYPNVFRVIDKENGNYGSCVNIGIELATGKYFRILDADDYYNTVGLYNLVEFLHCCTDNVDMIITKMSTIAGSIKTESELSNVDYKKVYDFPETDIGEKIGGYLFMHQTTYCLSTIKRSGLHHDEGVSYTDLEYIYIPLEYVEHVVFLDINLYQYVLGRDGQTMEIAAQIKHINDFYVVKDKLLPLYLNNIQNRPSNLLKVQRKIIINVLYPIYKLSLTEIGRKGAKDKEMRALAYQLKHKDIELWEEIKWNMGRLPVIFLWERFGVYATSYKILWKLYQYLKGLKRTILNR